MTKVSATNLSHTFPVAKGIPILPDLLLPPPRIPKINFKKKHIILWMPGTNDHLIPAKFLESVRQIFGDTAEVVLVDYPATQQYLNSRADGAYILSGTLDHIRANKSPDSKVYIAGLSQGAMVASMILGNPANMKLIERAVFMGHPGISPNHYDNHPKVKEFNNFLDPVTFDWAEDKDAFVLKIQKFLQGDIMQGVSLLGTFIHHPIESLIAGITHLHRVPILNFPKLFGEVHDYTEKMDEAASWLYHGYSY